MSEWLTTGQMIDRLKVGEVAENDSHCIERNDKGYFYTDGKGSISPYEVTLSDGWFLKMKWKIRSKHITFEEALTAKEEGKTIILHFNGEKIYFHGGMNFKTMLQSFKNVDSLCFDDLLKGKWTVASEECHN